MAEQNAALTPVHISARDIPPPATISPAAQKALSDGATLPFFSWPPVADKDAWRRLIATSDATREPIYDATLAATNATVDTVRIAGVVCYDCMPNAGARAASPVYLYIHGGALVMGQGGFAKMRGAVNAVALGVRTISVDYRMPPDHPFPAAPEDCVSVYKTLLETVDAKRIVIAGSSAGGNIAAAATLMIRDRGIPLPAGVVLLTPEVDLTESGDTFRTNADLDVALKRGLPECNAVYANGHDLRDPYVSPLFGDFSQGFPPTLIQSGTRDLFLSNSVRMHRRLRDAGVEAELHVWEAMPHAGFMPGEAPENVEIQVEVKRFFQRVVA